MSKVLMFLKGGAEEEEEEPSGVNVNSFSLTSLNTATAPYTLALEFAEGAMVGEPELVGETTYQAVIKRTWNDGSVKHAIISGRTALTADTPKVISVIDGTSPTGAALVAADIATAAPSASIQCGAIGTVNLSSLLATPQRTWISGHEMVECHYRAAVGADAVLTANFHVRLFADNSIWIRAFVENGYYDVTRADKTYVPTIIVDGVTAFTFATKTITGITQNSLGGSPAEFNEVITSNGHGFLTGQSARITSVGGMTELNDRYIGIASVTANTFTTNAHEGAYTTYTSGGSAAFSHFSETRYCAEAWIDAADPEVTPAHSTTFLRDSKLVPNYWKRNPSSTVLNSLTQTYVPMDNGDITAHQGNPGFQQGLGLLSQWDALYCTSADARAYRSVLANSSSLNSYAIVQRKASTGLVPKPSEVGSFTYADFLRGAGALEWKMTHGQANGYLAYLLTGDYWHYETMLMNAATIFLCLNGNGDRSEGLLCELTSETRGTSWNLRTLSQLAAIFPEGDAIGEEYQTLLANNISHWKGVKDGLSGVGLGYLWEYSSNGNGLVSYGVDGVIAPWQQHFGIASLGMGSDMDPLEDMTEYNAVRDWLYRAAVGILGTSSTYCFTRASNYNFPISDDTDVDPTTWFDTWDQVYDAGVAIPSGDGTIDDDAGCASNTLGGSSASVPGEAATGYWGNFLPAIAYAVDHGASGAAAAYARLTGASNFADLEESADVSGGFDDTPQWGIIPRTVPSWRLGLAVGEWVELTGSAMSNTPPSVDPERDSGGPAAMIYAWNGFSIDPRISKIWTIAPGGHGDWEGNPVYCLDLDDDTPTWIEMLASNSTAQFTSPTNAPYYDSSPARPASSHTYNSQHFSTLRNRAMRFGCLASCSIGNPFPEVDGYDSNAAVGVSGFDARDTYPDLPGTLAAGQLSVMDPVSENVWLFVQNHSVRLWTNSTNTWSTVNGSPPVSPLEGWGAYDTLRDRIFLFKNFDGAASPVCHTYDTVANTFTSRTLTGAAAAAAMALDKGIGGTYIPAIDSFLIRGGASGGTVYAVNAGTWVCTEFSTSGGSGIPSVTHPPDDESVWGRFKRVTQFEGMSYTPTYAGNTWFLRTH